ncbi:hypothetical protein Leryth_020610 [Lithospermum erythrorhizon]|nr:hypothetical protein Leryth_020610 [Lithospermum erythrorhizon]
MSHSVIQGFSKSLAMTVLSEIGDKTFFAAAILAMRHPRRFVLAGCLGALIVMTIFSALVFVCIMGLRNGLIITTFLFLGFGLWSLWDAFNEGEAEDLAEVEKQLDADFKTNGGNTKDKTKTDDLKKQKRPFLTQFFSPILLKMPAFLLILVFLPKPPDILGLVTFLFRCLFQAFSITFFGEWGDKSQWPSVMYNCSRPWWKELSISNIRTSRRSFWRNSFYCFRNPILPVNRIVMAYLCIGWYPYLSD